MDDHRPLESGEQSVARVETTDADMELQAATFEPDVYVERTATIEKGESIQAAFCDAMEAATAPGMEPDGVSPVSEMDRSIPPDGMEGQPQRQGAQSPVETLPEEPIEQAPDLQLGSGGQDAAGGDLMGGMGGVWEDQDLSGGMGGNLPGMGEDLPGTGGGLHGFGGGLPGAGDDGLGGMGSGLLGGMGGELPGMPGDGQPFGGTGGSPPGGFTGGGDPGGGFPGGSGSSMAMTGEQSGAAPLPYPSAGGGGQSGSGSGSTGAGGNTGASDAAPLPFPGGSSGDDGGGSTDIPAKEPAVPDSSHSPSSGGDEPGTRPGEKPDSGPGTDENDGGSGGESGSDGGSGGDSQQAVEATMQDQTSTTPREEGGAVREQIAGPADINWHKLGGVLVIDPPPEEEGAGQSLSGDPGFARPGLEAMMPTEDGGDSTAAAGVTGPMKPGQELISDPAEPEV